VQPDVQTNSGAEWPHFPFTRSNSQRNKSVYPNIFRKDALSKTKI
jgi:hypothetical protein